MSYMNRVWVATGVAAVNSLSDQGQKIKSGLKSLNYGKRRFSDASDIRSLSAVITSGVGGIIGGREQTEESLRQVLYLNCWGQG